MKKVICRRSKGRSSNAMGKALREYRLKLGLPARAVCHLANLTESGWYKVETEDRPDRALELLNILTEIQRKGQLDSIKQEHVKKLNEEEEIIEDKPRETLADAFAEIDELDNRLAWLETLMEI